MKLIIINPEKELELVCKKEGDKVTIECDAESYEEMVRAVDRANNYRRYQRTYKSGGTKTSNAGQKRKKELKIREI